MSIILKGIDLPSEKEGWQMDLRIHGFDDGTMMVEKLTRNGRPPFKMYRAIQIPKNHGNIIDESKAVVTETIDGYYEITAPTILEVEE